MEDEIRKHTITVVESIVKQNELILKVLLTPRYEVDSDVSCQIKETLNRM